jgi:hypothetical protein
VLLAWNADRMLMSFRGTASFVNVLADLQVHACVLRMSALSFCSALNHRHAAVRQR